MSPPKSAEPSTGTRRRKTVLIVEDDADFRELLAEHFTAAGYSVTTAMDGNEALAIAIKKPPNAIVLDLLLPRLDGWDTAELLRTYGSTSHVPIVVCTAVGHSASLERVGRVKGVTVLQKPRLPEEIQRAVEKALRAKVNGNGNGKGGSRVR